MPKYKNWYRKHVSKSGAIPYTEEDAPFDYYAYYSDNVLTGKRKKNDPIIYYDEYKTRSNPTYSDLSRYYNDDKVAGYYDDGIFYPSDIQEQIFTSQYYDELNKDRKDYNVLKSRIDNMRRYKCGGRVKMASGGQLFNDDGSWWDGAVNGAISGASTLSSFGPIGTILGILGGATYGGISDQEASDRKRYLDEQSRMRRQDSIVPVRNKYTPTYANGGNVDVELEKEEVVQTPDNELIEFDGPTHENGGIDTDLPVGSRVFSDRLKVDKKFDKTYARVAKAKIDHIDRLKRAYENNPSMENKNSYEIAISRLDGELDVLFDHQEQTKASMFNKQVELAKEAISSNKSIKGFTKDVVSAANESILSDRQREYVERLNQMKASNPRAQKIESDAYRAARYLDKNPGRSIESLYGEYGVAPQDADMFNNLVAGSAKTVVGERKEAMADEGMSEREYAHGGVALKKRGVGRGAYRCSTCNKYQSNTAAQHMPLGGPVTPTVGLNLARWSTSGPRKDLSMLDAANQPADLYMPVEDLPIDVMKPIGVDSIPMSAYSPSKLDNEWMGLPIDFGRDDSNAFNANDFAGNIVKSAPALYNLAMGLQQPDQIDATKYYPRNKYRPNYRSYNSILRRIRPLYGSNQVNPYERYYRANNLSEQVAGAISGVDAANAEEYNRLQQSIMQNDNLMRQIDMMVDTQYNPQAVAKQREYLAKAAEQGSQLYQMKELNKNRANVDEERMRLLANMYPDVTTEYDENGNIKLIYTVNGSEVPISEQRRRIKMV